MIVEVYEALGEPSDLSPYTTGTTLDLAAEGAIKILGWLNRAYKRILNWKFANGSQVRFPAQEGEAFFKSMVLTGTVASASSSTVVLDAGVDAEADRYNGCIVEITAGTGEGQRRLIVDFSGSRVATIDHDWDDEPTAASTYAVYKRTYKFRDSSATDADENISLSPVSEVAAISKLTDIKALSEIKRAGRIDDFPSSLLTVGIPMAYIPKGSGLVFDLAPDGTIWYKLEYVRVPPALALATDEPELPDSFNEALLLYAQWIGLRRGQEWGGAYATKRDIEDVMASLKTSLEMSFEREDIGAVIV